MSDSFSPLFGGRRPDGGSSHAFRVQVVNAGSLPSVGSATSKPFAPACDPAKPVKVSLEKNGDTVTGIRIDCGCGQVINLSCVY